MLDTLRARVEISVLFVKGILFVEADGRAFSHGYESWLMPPGHPRNMTMRQFLGL